MARIEGKPMKLKTRITITRLLSNYDESRPVLIKIRDEDSSCYILQLKLSLEEYARALMNEGDVECEAEFYKGAPIGKVREYKTELVDRPKKARFAAEPEARELLAPFNVDGWRGRAADLFNYHNWRGEDKVEVTFERWVEKTDAEEG